MRAKHDLPMLLGSMHRFSFFFLRIFMNGRAYGTALLSSYL